VVTNRRLPAPPDPEFSEWRALRIAEQEAILERHSLRPDGRCDGCLGVGLDYPGWSTAWPCGKYREAERLIDLLSGKTHQGT
jgi:hypothetical protein